MSSQVLTTRWARLIWWPGMTRLPNTLAKPPDLPCAQPRHCCTPVPAMMNVTPSKTHYY